MHFRNYVPSERNGWRTADRKAVANADLWRELAGLAEIHDVNWRWVRGHADDEMNNRCDALAVQARESLAQTLPKKRQA